MKGRGGASKKALHTSRGELCACELPPITAPAPVTSPTHSTPPNSPTKGLPMESTQTNIETHSGQRDARSPCPKNGGLSDK